MVACLLLTLCASGRSAGDTLEQESASRDFEERALHGTISEEEGFEQFDDFIVCLKDGCKRDRISVCAAAVQLNRGMRLPEEKAALRKVIYKTLQERSEAAEIGKGLREEIKLRLNGYMGEERVRNVYFTKFVVL